MAVKGTLVRWNGDKGFGFVRCDMDQKEYFVHISAFPEMVCRPGSMRA